MPRSVLRLRFSLGALALAFATRLFAETGDPKPINGFTTSQAAQAAVDAAHARVEQEEKNIKQLEAALAKLMAQQFSAQLRQPDLHDLDEQIDALRRELIDFPARRLAELRDLREGLYCGGCLRTKTEFLRNGWPFPHANQAIIQVPASPEKIAEKAAELDREEAALRDRIAALEQQREQRRNAWQEKLAADQKILDRARAEIDAARERRYRARCDALDALYAVSALHRRESRARDEADAAKERKERDERRDVAKKAREAEEVARKQREQQREAEARAKEQQRLADEARRRGDQAAADAAQQRQEAAKHDADQAAAAREAAEREASARRREVVQSGYNIPPSDEGPPAHPPPTPQRRDVAHAIWEDVSEHFDAAKEALHNGGQDALDHLRSGVEAAKEYVGANDQSDVLERVQERWMVKKDQLLDEATQDTPSTIRDRVQETVTEGLDDLIEHEGDGGKPRSFLEESRIQLIGKIKGAAADLSFDQIRDRIIHNAQQIMYDGKRLTPETTDSETNDAGRKFDESAGAPNLLWNTAPSSGAGLVKGVDRYLQETMNNFFNWSDHDPERGDLAPGSPP
jgi:hypothetical protein